MVVFGLTQAKGLTMHPGHWWEKEEEPAPVQLKRREALDFSIRPQTERGMREANRKMRARGSHHNHNRRKNKMPAR